MFYHSSDFGRSPRHPRLIQLMGGKRSLQPLSFESLSGAPLFETTGYGYEIHEMSGWLLLLLGKSPFPTNLASTSLIFFLLQRLPWLHCSTLSKPCVRKAFHPSWQAYPERRRQWQLGLVHLSALILPDLSGQNQVTISEFSLWPSPYLPWLGKNFAISMWTKLQPFLTLQECRLDKNSVSSIQHQDLLESWATDLHSHFATKSLITKRTLASRKGSSSRNLDWRHNKLPSQQIRDKI